MLFLAPPLLSLPTQTLSLLSTYSQSALLFVILLSPLNGIRFHPSTANCLSRCYPAWPTDELTIPTHTASLALPPTQLPCPQAGLFNHLASAALLNSPIIATKIGSFFRHLLSILTTSYSELLFTAILVTQLISMCLLTASGALLEGRLCSAHHRVSAPRTVPDT